MSNGKALAILLGVVIVVAAYLALSGWMGVGEAWAGFLFLLQWSMMEEAKLDRLPRSALGATLGVAIPFVPAWLAPVVGAEAGLAVMLAIILLAVFLLIRGLVTLLINASTMLFLTIVSIPRIASAGPVALWLGLLVGILFFGGLAAAAALLRSRAAATPDAAMVAPIGLDGQS
jgi:hypothetical protein